MERIIKIFPQYHNQTIDTFLIIEEDGNQRVSIRLSTGVIILLTGQTDDYGHDEITIVNYAEPDPDQN